MKKQILSVLICGLLIGTIFVIVPSDLKIKSVSADIIEDNSKLDYSTIYDITYRLSHVINKEEVYDDDEIEKGRAFGSDGEIYAATEILEKELDAILGEENVELELIKSYGDKTPYSNITCNLEVNSLKAVINHIEVPLWEEEFECYISPRYNLTETWWLPNRQKDILTNNFSYEDDWLDIRTLKPLGFLYYLNEMFESKFNSYIGFLEYLIDNNINSEELLFNYTVQELENEYNFSFEDIIENPENASGLPWYDDRIFCVRTGHMSLPMSIITSIDDTPRCDICSFVMEKFT